MTDPVGTAEAIGSAAVGGVQLLKDELGIPVTGAFGDQREAARAVGEHYADRYGSGQALLDTMRTDPVGFAADAFGVVSGVGGVGRTVTGAAAPARAAAKAAKGKTPSKREIVRKAPSKEALRREANMLYKAAEDAGVRFQGAEYSKFVDQLQTRMMREGMDPVLHPKIARLQSVLTDTRGRNPSLADLEIMRRQFGAAAGDADASTRRLGVIGQEMIDEFVESGSASATGTLKDARKTWARLRKSEIVEKAIERASVSQAGPDVGLRQEFRNLYKAIVSGRKDVRGFSAAEKKAIKAVAEGGAMNNTLRRLGALGGGIGTSRATLNAMVGGSLGYGIGTMMGGPLVGGPIGAAVTAGGGQLAARAARRGTERRADYARALAAHGGEPTAPRAKNGLANGIKNGVNGVHKNGLVRGSRAGIVAAPAGPGAALAGADSPPPQYPNARKAPDGRFYVQDEQGRFREVLPYE